MKFKKGKYCGCPILQCFFSLQKSETEMAAAPQEVIDQFNWLSKESWHEAKQLNVFGRRVAHMVDNWFVLPDVQTATIADTFHCVKIHLTTIFSLVTDQVELF